MGRLRHNFIPYGNEERICTHYKWSGLHLGYLGEGGIKHLFACGAIGMKPQSASACCPAC
jgi:hypothetical protein